MSEWVTDYRDPDAVKAFVADSRRTKSNIDEMLGGTGRSEGKNVRRWELYGAPPTTAILMAYIDKYGWAVAEEVAQLEETSLQP